MRPQSEKPFWVEVAGRFQTSTWVCSVWQLVNSVIPYLALWYLMYRSLTVSYWLTLALAVPAAGFLVRIFIIFHDCCHNSFMKSREANDVLGMITGVLTFTPYHQWRHEHSIHHATCGDLDRRGTGDIWLLTVQEYLESPRWMRVAYRLARNPLILFGIAPMVLFLVKHRFPSAKADKKSRRNVYWTDAGILATAAAFSWAFGIKAYFLIQLPVLALASSAGLWLFYVQHQFEGVYWERHARWDFVTASLRGASFYELPEVLRWFSGNIGFHHIHHLCPRIPNYNLKKCYEADSFFRNVKPITLFSSFKTMTLRLWDEPHRRLVRFSYLRTLRQANS